MNLLLDTHVWLWAGLDPDRLGPKARRLLSDQKNRAGLSIVSVWEIAIKASAKRLTLPSDVKTFVRQGIASSRVGLLDLSLAHIFALDALPKQHSDPFDRMLVAQAQCERLTLLTADSRLLAYPIAVIDARK